MSLTIEQTISRPEDAVTYSVGDWVWLPARGADDLRWVARIADARPCLWDGGTWWRVETWDERWGWVRCGYLRQVDRALLPREKADARAQGIGGPL